MAWTRTPHSSSVTSPLTPRGLGAERGLDTERPWLPQMGRRVRAAMVWALQGLRSREKLPRPPGATAGREGSQEVVHPGPAGSGRDVVSTGSTLQTQSCEEQGGGWGGGRPPSALLCPQACNCDQYLKVSRDLMTQLVGLSGQRDPRSAGEYAPQSAGPRCWLPLGSLAGVQAGRAGGETAPRRLGVRRLLYRRGCRGHRALWVGTLLSRGPCLVLLSHPSTRGLSNTNQRGWADSRTSPATHPPGPVRPSAQPQFPFLET